MATSGSPLVQYLDERGQARPGSPVVPDKTLLRMYRAMATARLIDDRCMKLQRQGRIGFYGTCTGEEAAAVGSAAALRPDDWVFPALRQGGVMLYRGWPVAKWFHHLFGTNASVERGRSMPCHYSDRAVNQVAWSSCMATQLPQAVGMAYAARLRGHDAIAAAYCGDGGTSEGDFHHACNFAGVWKAPVVFIVNNNQWAISVPFAKQTASGEIAVKAKAYGFPGVRVDGNDVLAVYETTRHAVERARRGDGPTLIECVTYRMLGHSTSDDPTRYRADAEVESWGRRDPLARFAKFLASQGVTAQAEIDRVHGEIETEIDAAVREAEAAPQPDARTLVEEVFGTVPWHLQEEFDDVKRFMKGGPP